MEIEFLYGKPARASVADLVDSKCSAVLLVSGDRPELHRRGGVPTLERSAFRATGERLRPILDASLREGLTFAALDLRHSAEHQDGLDLNATMSRLRRRRVDVVTLQFEPSDPANRRLLGRLLPPMLEAGLDVVLAGPRTATDDSQLTRISGLSSQPPIETGEIVRDYARHLVADPISTVNRQLQRALRERARAKLDISLPTIPGRVAAKAQPPRVSRKAPPRVTRKAPPRVTKKTQPTQAAAGARPTRFVNTLIGQRGVARPAPPGRPLARDRRYEVRVNIGQPDPGSLLPPAEGEWPQEHLPSGELRLRAVLRMQDWQEPMVAALTLPESGESFTCGCPEGEQHEESCEREPWLRFPIRTPDRDRRWRGSLDLYYRAALVHAQQLVLPVGDRQGGPRAEVTYRLTTSFANLGELAERTASLLVSDRGSRVTVNGLGFASAPLSLAIGAVDEAAYAARHELYDIHLAVDRNKRERNRYRPDDHAKEQVEFEADLRRLARLGADLFSGLASEDPDAWRALPELIRHEAVSRGMPPTLLIAEATDLPAGRHLPWALVYDLPVGSDPSQYRRCESVLRFGPGGQGGPSPVPAVCPVSDHLAEGEEDVLCPYGFWGLSCLLEQPPSAGTDARSVVSDEPAPVSVLAAVGSGLVERLTDQHLRQLRAQLGEAVAHPAIESQSVLADQLASSALDIAYLYAHCGNRLVNRSSAPSLYLQYGADQVGPLEIHKWSRRRGDRRLSWGEQRRPLVVLNGCHTVERSSSTLADLAVSFVRFANAAGVVGTEVSVDQGLASYVAEQLLDQVARRRQPVGRALHHVRWQLLARGNVMGLAYTPYCLSTLAVRPHDGDLEVA